MGYATRLAETAARLSQPQAAIPRGSSERAA